MAFAPARRRAPSTARRFCCRRPASQARAAVWLGDFLSRRRQESSASSGTATRPNRRSPGLLPSPRASCRSAHQRRGGGRSSRSDSTAGRAPAFGPRRSDGGAARAAGHGATACFFCCEQGEKAVGDSHRHLWVGTCRSHSFWVLKLPATSAGTRCSRAGRGGKPPPQITVAEGGQIKAPGGNRGGGWRVHRLQTACEGPVSDPKCIVGHRRPEGPGQLRA